MLTIFLYTFGFFAMAMLAMGVGLLFGRNGPQGSCGGLSAAGFKSSCIVCRKQRQCRKSRVQNSPMEENKSRTV